MGMYCCCDWKISRSADPNGCKCDWENWSSIYDWPPERKNKDKPFSLPEKDGIYEVRIQNQSGDRFETESTFTIKSRLERCRYTGKEVEVHWSGDPEYQPFAWKDNGIF